MNSPATMYFSSGYGNDGTFNGCHKGALRVSTATSSSPKLEVFDGSRWLEVQGGSTGVSLTPSATEALEWAKEKLREEQELRELAKEYPAVENILAEIEEKKKQLEMVKILVRKENNVQST